MLTLPSEPGTPTSSEEPGEYRFLCQRSLTPLVYFSFFKLFRSLLSVIFEVLPFEHVSFTCLLTHTYLWDVVIVLVFFLYNLLFISENGAHIG